jgi:hypothetical protein
MEATEVGTIEKQVLAIRRRTRSGNDTPRNFYHTLIHNYVPAVNCRFASPKSVNVDMHKSNPNASLVPTVRMDLPHPLIALIRAEKMVS